MNKIKTLPVFRAFVTWMNKHCPVLLTRLRFRMYFKRWMSMKNPKDLNEKILWLSLFTDTSEWTRLADKHTVRDYVKSVGCGKYLVPLYGKWNNVDDVDWESLPSKFVIKSNKGGSADSVLIVRDKSQLDIPKTKELMCNWLDRNSTMGMDQTEYHYIDIEPCIIAEELLENPIELEPITRTLIDYKIWCFNGKVYEIWTCSNRTPHGADVATFDLQWNYHPEGSVFNNDYRSQQNLVPKPKNLDEMIKVAEKLSAPFPVVRVDLYNIDGRIYFGEMTFTSNGGIMDFYTPEHLMEMGMAIDLSGVKKDRINRAH